MHHLKMVYTVSEDPHGHVRVHMHVINFSRGQMPLRKTERIGLFRRGRELHLDHLTSRGSVHWTVPLDNRFCEYHSVLCYNFVIFLKTMCICQGKGTWHTLSDGAPLPSHTRLVPPCTCLNLDLNPKIIWCYYYKNGWNVNEKKIEQILM